MASFRELMRFLFPKYRYRLNHGGRLINPYDLTSAEDEEKTLVLAGVARSPDDARILLKKFNTDRASVVLAQINRLKPPPTLRSRLILLIRRIDGHDERDPYGSIDKEAPTRIHLRYRYRRPDIWS